MASLDTIEIVEAPSERSDRGLHGETSGLKFHERMACRIVSAGPIPKHVAFIMDGNRRFARDRGWNVADGHRSGYDKLEETLRWCCELGVHGVTVYAFSIENFKRSAEEVGALMSLTTEKLRKMSEEDNLIQKRGVRVRIVGDLSRVSDELRTAMRHVMRMTQGNSKHTLTVCFSYTSRNEIASSVRRLADACADGRLEPDDVSTDLIERCLLTSTVALPPVDFIVRTSGERRLSDFLLWQSASCAVAFTHVLWPELSLLRFLSLLLRFQLAQPYMRSVAAATAAAAHADSTASKAVAASKAGRLRRAAAAAYPMLLLLFALGVLACITVAVVMTATGRSSPEWPKFVGSACVAAWLILALVGPEPLSASRRADGASSSSSSSSSSSGSVAADSEATPRVRNFLAELNVDRRL